MIVGTEWLIEAADCDAECLRDAEKLQSVFARLIADLELKTIGAPLWHKFPAPGAGVTGLVMLTESHLACHTYPENQFATFNLYCCRARPEWNWEKNLHELIGAKNIKIQKVERGTNNSTADLRSAVPSASGARSSAIADNHFASQFGTVKVRNRGYLPHWEKEGGTYFVTFNLSDALPEKVVRDLEIERENTRQILENTKRKLSPLEAKAVSTLFNEKVENYLDCAHGSCVLNNDEIAEIVAVALKYFDGERYRLLAWCVMPNHVHVVLTVTDKNGLSDVLQSWKSFTAKKANKLIGQNGSFWRREYYDRLIRNQTELFSCVQYVLNNPENAGLKNWRWVWSVSGLVDNGASAGRAHDSRQDVGGTN